MSLCSILSVAGFLLFRGVSAVDIVVSNEGGNATSGNQYGFLHEDINFSGDGGIYAELIRNRAFQFTDKFPANLDHWTSVNGAELTLETSQPSLSDVLTKSLKVSSTDPSISSIGFANTGYWGMDVKTQRYLGFFWSKGSYNGTFKLSFQSATSGDEYGSVDIESRSEAGVWTEHIIDLTPTVNAPSVNNTFAIQFDPRGTPDGSLEFNLISVFPPTYKVRPNGLRVDLAEAIEGLHPTLFRIPGGNMLEGTTSSTWWDWKDTLVPLRERPAFEGVWSYVQTHGLGLLEYLRWASDMDMSLVVGVFAGLALDGSITPREEMQPLIEDALNQIEFISGPVDSTWGSKRAELGFPEPWPIRYVEIGNEDWLAGGASGWETYKDYRFPMFLEAIGAKYPDVQVIASGAGFPGDWDIPTPGAGDHHMYSTPDGLLGEFDRFDNIRTPHLIGEMAGNQANGGDGTMMPYPFWIGAVGEAVALIGYERNADRIIGAAYAPVLCNTNEWQWPITIIQHNADPALTTRSVSWYVWELLARHTMTKTLPTTSDFRPLYYVAGINEVDNTRIFKVAAYNSTDLTPVSVKFEGVQAGTTAQLTILTGLDPYGFNDPYTGVNMVTTEVQSLIMSGDGTYDFSLPNLSVALLVTQAEE